MSGWRLTTRCRYKRTPQLRSSNKLNQSFDIPQQEDSITACNKDNNINPIISDRESSCFVLWVVREALAVQRLPSTKKRTFDHNVNTTTCGDCQRNRRHNCIDCYSLPYSSLTNTPRNLSLPKDLVTDGRLR
jgi:hypothetical protein